MCPLTILGIGFAFVLLVFTVTWAIGKRAGNYSIVDFVWSGTFSLVAIWFYLSSSGWEPRRLAICGLVAIWSLRLGTHLYRRIMSHHPEEDARYTKMRDEWGENQHRNMYFVFLFQAAVLYIMISPLVLITYQGQTHFHLLEWIGLALGLISIFGESTADAQLRAFKKTAEKHEICKTGLWRYSRHPNYFFEFLFWTSIFLVALPHPWGWTMIISPLTILVLLLKFTGIGASERHLLRSKGEAYRDYARVTSSFIPWPPKRSS